jgi:hypothetical protein
MNLEKKLEAISDKILKAKKRQHNLAYAKEKMLTKSPLPQGIIDYYNASLLIQAPSEVGDDVYIRWKKFKKDEAKQATLQKLIKLINKNNSFLNSLIHAKNKIELEYEVEALRQEQKKPKKEAK